MDVLEKLLSDLNGSLESADSKIDPVSLVANIEAVAMGEMESSDLEYVTTLLFESTSPPSLIQFLIDSSRTKDRELVKAKVHSLKFIASFIKLISGSIEPVAVKLFLTMIDLFKKEDSGETKAGLLLPAKNILRCCCRSNSSRPVLFKLNPERLNLDNVYRILIDDLKFNKKITKGTKSEVFKLLGLLVASYPDQAITISSVDTVLNLCETTLAHNFSNTTKDAPDFGTIAGCFSCLDRCLFEFEERFANNKELWKYLLQAAKAASQADVFRFAATNKALRLIKNHAELFQGMIGANAQKSYEVVLEAYRLEKKSISKHVQDALYAVMGQIASFVGNAANSNEDVAHAVQTLHSLSGQFMRQLEEGSSLDTRVEVDILHAVQGFAAIAPAMGRVLAAQKGVGKGVMDIVGSLVVAANHYIGSLEDKDQNKSSAGTDEIPGVLSLTYYIAHKKCLFLLAVTSLLNVSTAGKGAAELSLSPRVEVFLEEYVTDSVVGYSKLWTKQQVVVNRSLCQLAHGLVRMQQSALKAPDSPAVVANRTVYSRFLDYLVPALVMRTVSRTISGEDTNIDSLRLSEFTGETDDRLLFSYVPMWRELLVPSDKYTKALLMINWQPDYTMYVAHAVYDRLLSYVLHSANALDLGYEAAGDQLVLPNNMADQDVLLNLTTFLELLLPSCLCERLKYWASLLISNLVALARKYPLVSALYRLLGCVLKATEVHINSAMTLTNSVEGDGEWQLELKVVLHGLRPFLLEVQNQASTSLGGEFKDELLDSVLRLLLSCPVSLLSLHDVVPSVQMSLQTGLQAQLSVNVLSKHLVHNKNELHQYLPQLLPILDRYLIASDNYSDSASGQMYLKTATKLKASKVALVGGSDEDSNGNSLQFAILSFLGRLGGDNQSLLMPPQDTVQDSLAWSFEECILLDLPQPHDASAKKSQRSQKSTQAGTAGEAAAAKKMSLDKLLPRVVDLCASSSTDKQLLTAAAECLHALLLFMIGSANSYARNRDSPFSSIYEKVFPAVIKLAVSDSVSRLIFDKLLFQMVRWFSGAGQVHESDTLALLDALMAGLCDAAAEGAVREICARGMQEFFVWAVRQSSKKEMARHPASVNSLMDRLAVLAAHPSAEKRMAAVAVYKSIYRNLREESALVHKYAMNVLFLLLKALRQETNSASQQEIASTLLKYEEVIAVSVLSRDDVAGLISTDEERPFPRNLSDLVEWLWISAVTSEVTVFRRSGMRCFSSLCPLLYTSNTASAAASINPREVIAEYISTATSRGSGGSVTAGSSIGNLVLMLERRSEAVSADALVASVPIVEGDSLASIQKQQRWLGRLNTSIDSYNWLIKLRYVSPSDIFLSPSGPVSSSSSTTAKKRKEIGSGGASLESGGSILFDCISCCLAHFEQLLQSPEISPHEEDLHALRLVRLESLYRIILLVNSVLAVSTLDKNAALAEQFGEFLRRKGVWATGLQKLTMSAVLGVQESDSVTPVFPSLVDRQHSAVTDSSLSQAVRTLFSFLYVLEPAGSQAFNSVVSNATKSLFAKLETFSVSRYELDSFAYLYAVIHDCSLEHAIFGYHYKAKIRSLSVRTVLSICEAISGSSDPSVAEVGGKALQLVLDMGFPLVQDDVAEERSMVLGEADHDVGHKSLLGLLATPDKGTLLLDKYGETLSKALLNSNGECSLVAKPRNVGAFVDACVSERVDPENSNLYKLLRRVLDGVAAAQVTGSSLLPDGFVSNTLLVAFEPFLKRLPHTVVSVLLEVDSFSPVDQRSQALWSFCVGDMVAVLESAKSSPEDISARLLRIPYLVSGTSVSAPRPVSQFEDSPAAVDKITGALEELVANKFPLDTQSMSASSPEGKAYSKIFKSYLKALVHCGSTVLLRALLPSFREGAKHRYFRLLKSSLAAVVRALNTGVGSSRDKNRQYLETSTLCGFCIEMVVDEFQDVVVKRTLFDELCVPALLKTSSPGLIHIFCSVGGASGLSMLKSSSSAGGGSVIKQLYDITQRDANTLFGVEEVTTLLFVQASAYRLIETLYDRCSLNAIKEEVTKAFAGPTATGKELTQSVCRAAHKAIRTKTPINSPTEVAALLYSSAYRCLAITVAKSQSEEQFFDMFLFKEKPGEDVWAKVVDCSQQYDFENAGSGNASIFSTVAIGATQSDADGAEANQSARRRLLMSGAGGGFLSQYMSSTILEGSSLSQSAATPNRSRLNALTGRGSGAREEYESSQYDYDSRARNKAEKGEAPAADSYNSQMDVDNGAGRDNQQHYAQYDLQAMQEAAYAAGAIRGFDDHIIYLEQNHLNCQPAMSALVRVIQRMATVFASKWKDQGVDVLPRWLAEIRDKLADFKPSNHRNVRLFMLRLLTNQPVATIVKPWAQLLLPAIMECVMTDLCADRAATYNYFVRDVVFTLCDTWSEVRPDYYTKGSASQLLNFLLRNAYDGDASVLKENVFSIGALIKLWIGDSGAPGDREPLVLELAPLVELLSSAAAPTGGAHAKTSSRGSEAVKKRLLGLEVLKSVVQSAYPFLEKSGAAANHTSQLLGAIIDCVKFPRKEVMDLGCVVAGAVLHTISEHSDKGTQRLLVDETAQFKKAVESAVDAKILQKDGFDNVASCLRGLTMLYPGFLSREMVNKTMSGFAKMKSRAKYDYLDMLCRCSADFDGINIPSVLKPHIGGLLADLSTVVFGKGRKTLRLPMVQICTLLLLTKHVQSIGVDMLDTILGRNQTDGIGLAISGTAILQVREAGYQFLLALAKLHPVVGLGLNKSADAKSTRVRKYLCQLLLGGLRDADKHGMDAVHDVATVNPPDAGVAVTTVNSSRYENPWVWTDDNAERVGIRRQIFEYFHEQFGLGDNLTNRLRLLMTELFDPAQSDQWLQYSSYLLLSLSTSTPECTAVMFPTNLASPEKYSDLEVSAQGDKASSQFLSALTPMFALDRTQQTLSQAVESGLSASQLSASQANFLTSQNFSNAASSRSLRAGTQSVDYSQRQAGYLRGTQQFSWTQTQQVGGTTGSQLQAPSMGKSRNKLAVDITSSQYLVAPATQRFGAPAATQAAGAENAVAVPVGIPKYVTTQRVPLRFSGRSQSQAAGDAAGEEGNAVDGAKKKVTFSGLAALEKDKKLARELRKRKGGKVVVYRKYRDGELPDISIQLADILKPLQSLCLMDASVASTVFGTVFDLLFRQANEAAPDAAASNTSNSSSRAADVSGKSLATCLQSMLQLSRGAVQNSLLTATLLAKCLSCLRVERTRLPDTVGALQVAEKTSSGAFTMVLLPADLVTECGVQSLNFHGAIQFLEEQLLAVEQLNKPKGPPEEDNAATRKKSKKKSAAAAASLTDSVTSQDLFDAMGSNNPQGFALTQKSQLVSAGVVGAQLPTQGIWRQLSRLYDKLNENDVLLGLATRLSEQHEQQTKLALDAEINGNYPEAIRIYASLNEQADAKLFGRRGTAGSRNNDSQEEMGSQGSTAAQFLATATAGPGAVSQEERDMWDDRSLLCLQQLCDWKELYSSVEKMVGGALDSADDLCTTMSALSPSNSVENRLKERVMPYYIRSMLHLGDESADEFGSFVDRILTYMPSPVSGSADTTAAQYELRQWVEQNFPIELAANFASRNQWSRVKVYTDNSYSQFLNSWSTLHPCAYQARKSLLTKLQRTVELRDSAEFFGTGRVGKALQGSQRNYDDLLQKWTVSEPAMSDPVCHWADVSRTRHITLKNSGGGGAEYGVNSALHLAKFHVRSAIAAVHQGILHAVKPQLETNNALRRSVYGRKALLTMLEVQVVFNYNKKSISRQAPGSPEILGMYTKTLGLLEKKAELQGQEEARVGDTAQLAERLQLTLMRADWLAAWAQHDKLSGVVSVANDTLSYKNKSFDALDLYHRVANETADVAELATIRAKTFGKFAAHCDSLLRDLEDGNRDIVDDFAGSLKQIGVADTAPAAKKGADQTERAKVSAATLAAQAYVNGLVSGSDFCRDRVLRVMSIVGSYPVTERVFRDALADIPAWTFLRYAAQLMGGLDKPEGPTIAAILEHIAVKYPKAIYYPYRITAEFLGAQGRQLSSKLRLILQDSALDAFIEALGGLTHPELRWSDGLKALTGMLRQLSEAAAAAGGKIDDSSMVAFYQTLRKTTIDVEWEHVGSKIGAYNKHWAKTHRAQADSIAGVDGEKLRMKNVLANLRQATTGNMKFSSGKVPLNEFSQWLSDLDPLVHRIEVPGQYLSCSDRPPSPERHETIMGIDPQLLVMSSIRKPKRIKFFGSNGSEFMFLVKGGEDLRNDERIEQLFVLMNSVVESKLLADSTDSDDLTVSSATKRTTSDAAPHQSAFSKASSIHGLRARTYVVIPMTSSVGVLEWVSNTVPLKSIVMEEMARDAQFVASNKQALENDKKEMNLQRLHAYDQRLEWVGSHDAGDYHKMFVRADKAQATSVFNSITADIPTHFLRRRLLSLAMNAEAFLTLRAEFAKTLAVSSLFGYILGLGDRHLDNLLMDTRTGGIVQIDFGICFGMGSSVLPVPEFMPFRLTPQLREVLQPLDGKGLLRHYMVKCMQFLREDEEEDVGAAQTPKSATVYTSILANALEIYVNDPVVDWLKSPLGKEEMLQLRDDVQWEPRRRVHAAVRKLQGVSPVKLFSEDLELNGFVRKEKSLGALIAILNGCVSGGVEASAGQPKTKRDVRLPVGEQVDQLIAISTDPNVLVRQWTGLQTWI